MYEYVLQSLNKKIYLDKVMKENYKGKTYKLSDKNLLTFNIVRFKCSKSVFKSSLVNKNNIIIIH